MSRVWEGMAHTTNPSARHVDPTITHESNDMVSNKWVGGRDELTGSLNDHPMNQLHNHAIDESFNGRSIKLTNGLINLADQLLFN